MFPDLILGVKISRRYCTLMQSLALSFACNWLILFLHINVTYIAKIAHFFHYFLLSKNVLTEKKLLKYKITAYDVREGAEMSLVQPPKCWLALQLCSGQLPEMQDEINATNGGEPM